MVPPSPPLVLITRPEDQAQALRRDLEARGYAALVEPLLTIRPLGPMAPLADDVQAILLTSANAVFALSEEAKQLTVFAVGKATARAAEASGCRHVRAGDSDGRALARLIARQCRPEDGALLHIGGEVVREEMHRCLEDQGFALRHEAVYRALPAVRFSDAVLDAWHERAIAAVLLFSPRTAEILVRLLIEHDLAGQVDRTVAICVSEQAASPCRELDWKEICLAPQPSSDALIRTLEGSVRIC